MGEIVITAGIGCRKGADGAAVLAAVDAALGLHRLSRGNLARLATAGLKAGEPGIADAARRLGLPLCFCEADAMRAVERDTLTRSARSLDVAGVGSVSEASALAAAGPGAWLLGARVVRGPVTCALAASDARA